MSFSELTLDKLIAIIKNLDMWCLDTIWFLITVVIVVLIEFYANKILANYIQRNHNKKTS